MTVDTGTDCMRDTLGFLDTGNLLVGEFTRAMKLIGDMPVDEILKLRPIEFARHIFQLQQEASRDSSPSTKTSTKPKTKGSRRVLTQAECAKVAVQFIKSLNDLYITPTNNASQDVASTHGSTCDTRLTLSMPVDETTLNQVLKLLAGDPAQ